MASEKPISVGDLVMVVRGHVCDLGNTFKVAEIDRWHHWDCTDCGYSEDGDFVAAHREVGGHYGAPLSWLRRIPPLDELETVRTEDEVTA